MIKREEFIQLVLKNFKYLELKFNFKYMGNYDVLRVWRIYYTKKDLIIEIDYNFGNNYIDINIFKKTNRESPYFWDNVRLGAILIKNNKDHKLEDRYSSINEIIENKSILLIENGYKILNDEEWYTWKDVVNFQK